MARIMQYATGDIEARRYSLVAFCILATALVISYGETFYAMVETWWRSETFNHGFIILPVSMYLAWQLRNELRKTPFYFDPIFGLPIAVLAGVWFVSRAADILIVQQFSVVTMFILLVPLAMGREVARRLIFPLGYLYFMVPFGEFLIPKLQDITAYIAVRALQLSGVPVYWEGLYFTIPSGSFEVAEACSGLRYLIASVALGTLYAYLVYESLYKRALFIALSVIFPLLANGIRAYGIVMLAHLSDYKLAVGVDHFIYGWLFFGLVITIMFWVGSYFRDSKPVRNSAAKEMESGKGVGERQGAGVAAISLAAVLLIMVFPPLATEILATSKKSYTVRVDLPDDLAGFVSRENIEIPSWAPENSGATVRIAQRFVNKEQFFDLYLAAYSSQQQGEELVSINSRLLPRQWVRTSEEIIESSGNAEEAEVLRKIEAKHINGSRILIYQKYLVNGRHTPYPWKVKVFEIMDWIKGEDVVSALVMIGWNTEDLYDGVDQVVYEVMRSLRERHILMVQRADR